MKNVKRVLAMICIVVLLAMYVVTFIMAITDSSETMAMFKGCIAVTIFVPVVAYGFICLHRYAMNRSKRSDPYSGTSSTDGSASSEDTQTKPQ